MQPAASTSRATKGDDEQSSHPWNEYHAVVVTLDRNVFITETGEFLAGVLMLHTHKYML